MKIRSTLAADSLATSAPALPWGAEGHQIVAEVAYSQLTPKATAGVDLLLAREPGATPTSVSTWADEHKAPATARWHFVNFPRGNCHYEPACDCSDGECVVAAIERERAVLASDASSEKRLKALKYVVHLVGDIHQPLRTGWGDDKGGSTLGPPWHEFAPSLLRDLSKRSTRTWGASPAKLMTTA